MCCIAATSHTSQACSISSIVSTRLVVKCGRMAGTCTRPRTCSTALLMHRPGCRPPQLGHCTGCAPLSAARPGCAGSAPRWRPPPQSPAPAAPPKQCGRTGLNRSVAQLLANRARGRAHPGQVVLHLFHQPLVVEVWEENVRRPHHRLHHEDVCRAAVAQPGVLHLHGQRPPVVPHRTVYLRRPHARTQLTLTAPQKQPPAGPGSWRACASEAEAMGASSKDANSTDGGAPRSASTVCATSANGDTGQRDSIERRICARTAPRDTQHPAGYAPRAQVSETTVVASTCSTYAFGIRWSCTAHEQSARTQLPAATKVELSSSWERQPTS